MIKTTQCNVTSFLCPACGRPGLTIAMASNWFGSWMCRMCGASGSYPPALSCKEGELRKVVEPASGPSERVIGSDRNEKTPPGF